MSALHKIITLSLVLLCLVACSNGENGEEIVGRIDSAVDRKTGVLNVKGLWWEEDVRRTKKLSAELEKTLRRFAQFNACEKIAWTQKEDSSQQPE